MSYGDYIEAALRKKAVREAIPATAEQKDRAKKRLSELDNLTLTWSQIEIKMERENLKAIINS